MPELPEVETVRRQLLPICRGERITSVLSRTAYLHQDCSPAAFSDLLAGRTVTDISRRGKFLIFHCEGLFPVFHLGMSGIFLKNRADSRYPQHIHVDITFQSGREIFFQDSRKFGKIWLYRQLPEFPSMGIDPVVDKWTPDDLGKMLAARRKNIKLFLMEQSFITGIGNIYASEILFRAGISPFRISDSLTETECAALFEAIHEVLNAAIERFGTTYTAYRTVNGTGGENQNFLNVYQRAGAPCTRCGAEIYKTVMGSRSTFYCQQCQH